MTKEQDSDAKTLPDANWCRRMRAALLRWYDRHARDLPWRQTDDLYAIWVSEIMLQQTQVATVIDYYERFLQQFPDAKRLAAASEEAVLRAWEGLGYYRRARQLHRAAQQIVAEHDGRFPETFADVLALPGIGRYTAGAILSLGQGQRLPILEANTIRLYCRLTSFDQDPTKSSSQKFLWDFAERILPRKRVAEFNQALMEMGSLVCAHPVPKCLTCPLASLCEGRLQGRQDELPVPKKRTQYTDVTEAAVVVVRDGRWLLRRCGPDERWAGLWDFPRFALQNTAEPGVAREVAEKTQELTGITIENIQAITTLKHGVTRYRITLLCHRADFRTGELKTKDCRWMTPENLKDLPLNVTGRLLSEKIAAGQAAL